MSLPTPFHSPSTLHISLLSDSLLGLPCLSSSCSSSSLRRQDPYLAFSEILSKSANFPVDLVLHAGNLWGGGGVGGGVGAGRGVEGRGGGAGGGGGRKEEGMREEEGRKVEEIAIGGGRVGGPGGGVDLIEWHKMVKLLRDNVFGNRSIDFEVVWDKRRPNYAYENINVGLPIWGIEGKAEGGGGRRFNEEELTTKGGAAAAASGTSMGGVVIGGSGGKEEEGWEEDGVWPVLETEGYVNWLRSDHFPLSPVLIKKGETKVGIYGLNYVRKTKELLEKGKIRFIMPAVEEEVFTVLLIHLDGRKEEPEELLKYLPKELDLVVVGGVEMLNGQKKNNASFGLGISFFFFYFYSIF